MKLLMMIAAIGVALCTQVQAGERCAPTGYRSKNASVRNVVDPGPVIVRPGDTLILVNTDQVAVVNLGDPAKHADRTTITIKDCMGRASQRHIVVTGETDSGDFTMDGDFSAVSFMALGNMWIIL